jgi:hypothetical protein
VCPVPVPEAIPPGAWGRHSKSEGFICVDLRPSAVKIVMERAPPAEIISKQISKQSWSGRPGRVMLVINLKHIIDL